MPILKMNVSVRLLALSVLPCCRERPRTIMCLSELSDRLKCRVSGFDAPLSFLSTSRKCLQKQSPSLLLVSQMYLFLYKVHALQRCM